MSRPFTKDAFRFELVWCIGELKGGRMRSFRWTSVGLVAVLISSCSSSTPVTIAEVDKACRNRYEEGLRDFVQLTESILLENGFDQETIDKSQKLASEQLQKSWAILQDYDRQSDFLALMREILVDADFPEQLQEFDEQFSGGNDFWDTFAKVDRACLSILILRGDGILTGDEFFGS